MRWWWSASSVPALPLLFAVGALVGLGHINGPYAVACAALGAFLGDALSFWVGRRWGTQLRQRLAVLAVSAVA